MAVAKKKKDYLILNVFLGVIIILLIILIISVFVGKKRQPNTEEIVQRVINELASNLNQPPAAEPVVVEELLVSPEEVERLDPDHDGVATYTSDQYGFRMDYPVTWLAAEDEAGVLFWDGFTSLVAINKGSDITAPDSEVNDQVEEVMIDGEKGQLYHRAEASDNGEVEVVEVIFPDKNSADKYSLMSTTYDPSKMMASFKFLAPEEAVNTNKVVNK